MFHGILQSLKIVNIQIKRLLLLLTVMTNSKNLKEILLYPEKMDIDRNGVKNFFWPIKLNCERKFKIDLLKELELFSKKEKKNAKDIIFLILIF